MPLWKKKKWDYFPKKNTDEKELQELQKKIVTLQNEQKNINQKYNRNKLESQKKDNLITYASKLSLSNFILKGAKVKGSGKEVETDRAHRIDRINISFDINENLLVSSGNKTIFIRILSSDGAFQKFQGKNSGNFFADGASRTYSDKTSVKYIQGQPQTVELQYDGDNFQKGDYILEVYENTKSGNVLIGKATKTLE